MKRFVRSANSTVLQLFVALLLVLRPAGQIMVMQEHGHSMRVQAALELCGPLSEDSKNQIDRDDSENGSHANHQSSTDLDCHDSPCCHALIPNNYEELNVKANTLPLQSTALYKGRADYPTLFEQLRLPPANGPPSI